MTKIKFCGLTRLCDIETANLLIPEYIGFVFAPKSRRYVSSERAAELKKYLRPEIRAIGVFVDEPPKTIAGLLKQRIIDLAQLHGSESADYIRELRQLTDRPILQAIHISTAEDIRRVQDSPADCVLLDSGSGGTGTTFNWSLIQDVKRPYFLAGGLAPDNVKTAVRQLTPYGVDVSSGIETNGRKDPKKMAEFIRIVRNTA